MISWPGFGMDPAIILSCWNLTWPKLPQSVKCSDLRMAKPRVINWKASEKLKVFCSSLLVFLFFYPSLCSSVHMSACLSACLLAILQKNIWTDFHEIFRIGLAWNKEHSGTFWGRLFYAWLDCLTSLQLGMMEVSLHSGSTTWYSLHLIVALPLKIEYQYMKSTGAQSSNEVQWL